MTRHREFPDVPHYFNIFFKTVHSKKIKKYYSVDWRLHTRCGYTSNTDRHPLLGTALVTWTALRIFSRLKLRGNKIMCILDDDGMNELGFIPRLRLFNSRTHTQSMLFSTYSQGQQFALSSGYSTSHGMFTANKFK